MRTMQAAAPDTDDEETPILGVEDIPGAISSLDEGEPAAQQTAPTAQPAEAGNELRDRLAAFRARRAGGAGGAGGQGAGAGRPGGGQFAGRAGGGLAGRGGGAAAGAGAGGAGRAAAGVERVLASMANDPIAAGRKILDQLHQRMSNDTRGERKPMRTAIEGIKRGYDALEQEVAKLRHELNLAHEAIRAVQGQGD